MNPTTIFIVDDHPLVREWLGHLLRTQPDFHLVGEASDPDSALTAMLARPPDVAVVDLTFKHGSGLDLIKSLRQQLPAVAILVHSMHEELTVLERAFRAGAGGYVMKRETTTQIITAIREVRAGRIFAGTDIVTRLTARLFDSPSGDQSPATLLSDRELQVFQRLGRGDSPPEIAAELEVNLKTVQTYCARIKEKLGLADGLELSYVALRWHQQAPPPAGP